MNAIVTGLYILSAACFIVTILLTLNKRNTPRHKSGGYVNKVDIERNGKRRAAEFEWRNEKQWK